MDAVESALRIISFIEVIEVLLDSTETVTLIRGLMIKGCKLDTQKRNGIFQNKLPPTNLNLPANPGKSIVFLF